MFSYGIRIGDGKDDYLAIDDAGTVTAFINGGQEGSDGLIWYPQNTVASASSVAGSQVRFADIDGDGKADYLIVNDDGSVNCWINGGLKDGAYTWNSLGQIATGFGDDGAGVVFADIDGDGKAEYLWVSQTGEVTAYLNAGGTPPNWEPQGTIASGVGASRAEVVFADLNGEIYRYKYFLVTKEKKKLMS